MDFEKELREKLRPQHPGPRFAEKTLRLMQHARARRKSGRIILSCALLALAAAAAMLVNHFVAPPPIPGVSVSTVSDPFVSSSASSSVVDKSPLPTLPMTPAVERPQNVFTVAVLPLRFEIEDASHRAAAREVHAAMLESLASIPNLALVSADTPADFTMTLTGKALRPDERGIRFPASGPNAAITERIMSPAGMYRVEVKIDAATQDQRDRNFQTIVLGPLPDLCQPMNGRTPPMCVTPMNRVQATLKDIRLRVFPPDFTLHREYLARFRNTSLTPGERSMALQELSGLSRERRIGFWEGDWQPADLALAMELAKAQSPGLPDNGMLRTLLLEAMHTVKNPDFVGPLIHLLQQDASEEVRLEAARILASNFTGNPAARSALEAASRTDSSEFVQQIAKRSLLGDKAWRAEIIATLNDSRQSVVARVKPLVLGERTSFAGPLPIGLVPSGTELEPDDSMVMGVVNVFPSLMTDPEWLEVSDSIMRILESSNHPAVKDAMLQALKDERDPSIAMTAASYLLGKYGDSPEVRRQVEEAAATRSHVREILDERPTSK
jgi:hypothetical protein